uniref:Uncharacterized protein n=1 Tax=Cannabis sativa TaxID=3483 RepID=A0A803NHD6_CANSA
MIESTTKARNFKAPKDKYVSDDFIVQIEGTPIEDIWACYSEYMIQGVTVYSRAFAANQQALKDYELLKKQNSALQDGLKKAKLYMANKDKKIEDFGKEKDRVDKKIKKLEEQITNLTRNLNNEKEEKKKAYD